MSPLRRAPTLSGPLVDTAGVRSGAPANRSSAAPDPGPAPGAPEGSRTGEGRKDGARAGAGRRVNVQSAPPGARHCPGSRPPARGSRHYPGSRRAARGARLAPRGARLPTSGARLPARDSRLAAPDSPERSRFRTKLRSGRPYPGNGGILPAWTAAGLRPSAGGKPATPGFPRPRDACGTGLKIVRIQESVSTWCFMVVARCADTGPGSAPGSAAPSMTETAGRSPCPASHLRHGSWPRVEKPAIGARQTGTQLDLRTPAESIHAGDVQEFPHRRPMRWRAGNNGCRRAARASGIRAVALGARPCRHWCERTRPGVWPGL